MMILDTLSGGLLPKVPANRPIFRRFSPLQIQACFRGQLWKLGLGLLRKWLAQIKTSIFILRICRVLVIKYSFLGEVGVLEHRTDLLNATPKNLQYESGTVVAAARRCKYRAGLHHVGPIVARSYCL